MEESHIKRAINKPEGYETLKMGVARDDVIIRGELTEKWRLTERTRRRMEAKGLLD